MEKVYIDGGWVLFRRKCVKTLLSESKSQRLAQARSAEVVSLKRMQYQISSRLSAAR